MEFGATQLIIKLCVYLIYSNSFIVYLYHSNATARLVDCYDLYPYESIIITDYHGLHSWAVPILYVKSNEGI